jgi:hypothetical protein
MNTQIVRSFAIATMLTPFAAGCSGADPNSRGGTSGPPVGPSSAVHTQSALHLALETSATTPVAIRVMPRAACTIAEGDPSRRIPANDEGVIRFLVTPKHEGTATISLSCRGETGATATYPVELTGTSDVEAIRATKIAMDELNKSKPGTLRPALAGDPMSYSQEELVAKGYGTRPDPVQHADRYAHWLRAVSQPTTLVIHRDVATPQTNGPNENLWFQSSWSGGVAGNPGGPNAFFYYASAEWIVPQVFAESSIGNQSNASTWAGVGGTNGDWLWQAGTEEWTQSFLWFESAGYNSWTENWPFESQQNSSVSVNNGDDIFVEVYLCDFPSTAMDPFGTSMCAHIHNYTQNQDDFRIIAIPTGAGLLNAEVIQERPTQGSSQNDYAQFNAFNFTSTSVCASADTSLGTCNAIGAVGNFIGPSPFSTRMAQIGSAEHLIGRSCMADSNGNCTDNGSFVRVSWAAHN